MANLFVKAKFILANKRCACYFWLYKTLTVDCDIAFYLFSVNSSEMRSISDRIAASPLRVPASPSRFSLSSPPSRNEPLNISLEHVVKLTHNFAPTLMIGEGYFGKVYRAALLDGRVVAIKRAKKVTYFCPGNYSSNFPSYNDLVLARMVPVWVSYECSTCVEAICTVTLSFTISSVYTYNYSSALVHSCMQCILGNQD
jgi:hypothetical protein